MLIPCDLVKFWRGITDPDTGEFRDLDTETPVTDYDRACAAATSDSSILDFRGAKVLILYTETDQHGWDQGRQIVACGGWFPTHDEIRNAVWKDPIRWHSQHTDYFLMNSAADGGDGLSDDDYLPVRLELGVYTIESATISGEYYGIFHRLVRDAHLDGPRGGPFPTNLKGLAPRGAALMPRIRANPAS